MWNVYMFTNKLNANGEKKKYTQKDKNPPPLKKTKQITLYNIF